MNTRQTRIMVGIFVGAFLLIVVPVLYSGCGSSGSPTSSSGSSGGTGTSGTSGVTITGSVTVPQSTSASVSVGSSVDRAGSGVSKSVTKGGGSGDRIIVYKAISDFPATSGTMTCKKLDGTVLDTGTIGSDGTISGVIVDPTQVDSTSQVLVEATVGTKKVTSLVDLTGKSTGETASAGTVNTDSTLSVQQVYYQGDPNCTPDNPSACAAKFASGEIKPKALFKVFKNACEDSSTSAGSSNAAASSKAVCQAFRAAMANAPVSFSEMNTAFQDSSILSRWGANDSSLADIPWSTAHGNFQKFGPAIVKTFEDSATFSKYNTAGDAGWESSFRYFGGMTSTELQNGVDHPAVFQGYMGQNATAYNNGDTTAFNAMRKPGAARAMGQMAGKFTAGTVFTSDQFEAMKKLMDAQKDSFDTLAEDKYDDFGESMFNQLKAADSATELAALKANPGSFVGKIFDRPEAYLGTAGQTTFDNQFITYVQNPTNFTSADARGCSTDLDCPAGAPTCTPDHFCMPTCTSNCGYGSKCTTNANCATNYCNSDGKCSMNPTLVNAGGGSMFTQMHGPGGSCNFTYECFPPLSCNSGTCSSFENWGGISYASGLGAVAGNQQVTLNWIKISGATGYKIYRSSSGDGTYTLLITVGDVATYLNTGLTNGTTYYYKIKSSASMGDSELSALVGATPASSAVQLAGVVTDFVGPAPADCPGANCPSADDTTATGTAARFNNPFGICITPDGATMYVMGSMSRIKKVIIATRAVTTYVGSFFGNADGQLGSTAEFQSPQACVIDSTGTNMYIADADNGNIRKLVLATSAVTTLAGSNTENGNPPRGTAGRADGTGTAASFQGPNGIVIDNTDTNLYVVDAVNNAIRKIVVSSGVVTHFAGSPDGLDGSVNAMGDDARFDDMTGISIDPTSTNLYVSDMGGSNAIRKIVIATRVVSNFVAVQGPFGSVVDPTNTYLYFADAMNNRIHRVTIANPAENIAVAGKGNGDWGVANGTGVEASFNSPTKLVLDPTGSTLYVDDFDNNRIVKIR